MVAAGSAADAVFRSFFVLLIWFQLWAPLFSVANYLMISVDANPMNRIASSSAEVLCWQPESFVRQAPLLKPLPEASCF